MLSGYNQLPQQEMYWQRREDKQDRMATALMIKNEFEEIKHFLHLADNKTLDKLTDLQKLDLFSQFDAVNKQCVAYYKPEQNLSVDKSMVPYFRKHGAKQLYRIHGNQLSLATEAVGTGKAVAMLYSIPSVSKNTCNTVKICHRFYFLDQGHSSVNMYVSVLPITGLLRGRTTMCKTRVLRTSR